MPIVDDDVLWLSHFRLLGRHPRVPQGPPEETQEDEVADPPKIYFLSGPGRVRRSRAEFLQGGIVGTPWGEECRRIKGEGVAEVWAISISVFYDLPSHGNRLQKVLVVHEDCYNTVLPRAMDYTQKENRHWRHLPMKSLQRSIDVMHSNLFVSGYMVDKNQCDAEEFSQWWGDGAADDWTRKDWLQVKRVCFVLS